MSKQLDATPEERQVADQKLQRKLFLRNEFLKQKSDPFQHAIGEGGAVFDSAFLKFQSLQVNYVNFFKPTSKLVFRGIVFLVFPMVGFGYLLNSTRTKREAEFRRGEVAYKDRSHKFA